MTANILCPGPSLARCQSQPADLVVAVNRAAIRFPCDVWAAVDPELIQARWRQVLAVSQPKLLTARETPGIVARAGVVWPGEVVVVSTPATSPETGGIRFTFTDALLWAGSQPGVDRVDVYGYDGAGNLDFDGEVGGTNRSGYRWTAEAQIYQQTVKALGIRGTEVIRHG